jgi:hypothetical protein
LVSHLKELAERESGLSPTRRALKVELDALGLLGREFGPDDYRNALERWLGMSIFIEEIPDHNVVWARDLDEEGHMAEVVCNPARSEAVVLVRSILKREPWPVYELSVYHELSHLAAGHPARVYEAGRGEVTGSFRDETLEDEAAERASLLTLAGSFPEAFKIESFDRVA